MSRRKRVGGSPKQHQGVSSRPAATPTDGLIPGPGLAGSKMAARPAPCPLPLPPSSGSFLPSVGDRTATSPSRDQRPADRPCQPLSPASSGGDPVRRGLFGPTDCGLVMAPQLPDPAPGESLAPSPPGEMSSSPPSPLLLSPVDLPRLPSPQPTSSQLSLGAWAQGPPRIVTPPDPEVRPALSQYAFCPKVLTTSPEQMPLAPAPCNASLGLAVDPTPPSAARITMHATLPSAPDVPPKSASPSSPSTGGLSLQSRRLLDPPGSNLTGVRPLNAHKPSGLLLASSTVETPADNSRFTGTPPLLQPEGILDIHTLLRQMPTKADFETYLSRMESRMQRNFDAVHSQIDSVDKRVLSLETSNTDVLSRLAALESRCHSADLPPGPSSPPCPEQLSSLQLQIDDLENRHRRNNLRIRGLPEATSSTDLKPTIVGIFNSLLGRDPSSPIELDRVHRTPGPSNSDPARPRDIVCRVHFYTVKEEIVRKAWLKGPFDYDGATLHILPDLSGRTLLRRKLLRPLLDRIKDSGALYKWGFPFHLLVRRAGETYTLRSPLDLPDLFQFLRIDPIPVPDWINLDQSVPRSQRSRRPGPLGPPPQSTSVVVVYPPARRAPRPRRSPAHRPSDPRAPED